MQNASFEALQWLYYRSVVEDRHIRHAMNDINGERNVFGKKVDGFFLNEQNGQMIVYEYQGCMVREFICFLINI